MFKYLLSLLLLANLILAIPIDVSNTLLTPAEDDFYTIPANISDFKLGLIINYRLAPAELSNKILPIDVKNVWQILYRSSDTFGNPTAVVGTIMEPNNGNPGKLLSYQTFEDSSDLNCSPSYAILKGSSNNNTDAKIEMFLIQTALDQGWYIVSPDYEGLNSAFTAGIRSGHAVLDGIRAALSSSFTDINNDASVAMWGYSGGSLASGWAASLQPSYANEIDLIGVAVGGFVTNITSVAVAVEGGSNAGIAAAAIAGLANEYPDLKKTVYEQLVPSKVGLFNRTADVCLSNSDVYFKNVNFFSGDDRFFQDGWGIFSDSVVSDIISSITLGVRRSEMPNCPVFLYHGEKDTTVPYEANAQRIFEIWQSWGINSLEFSSDETANHPEEFVLGAAAAMTWIEKRFQRQAPVSGAVKTRRFSNLFYPGIDVALLETLEAGAKVLVGLDLGPDILNYPSDILLWFNKIFK